MRKFSWVGTLSIITLAAGCAMTPQEKGTVIGGATGAAVGTAIGAAVGEHTTGHGTQGGIIGGVAGGLLGAWIGQRMTEQTQQLEQVPGVEDVNYDQQTQTIEAQMKVHFDVDKWNIKPTESVKLDELAKVFAQYPENIVVIEGHTDSDGSDSYNQKLSENRAASVAAYLRQKNINIASLNSVGYGESRPVASNATPEGKAQNRRVEIKISVDQSRVPPQPGAGTTGTPAGTR